MEVAGHDGAAGGHARHGFLFIVRRIADTLADDQHHFIDRRRRVVSLFKMPAVARLHDPASRIREVILHFGIGHFTRRRGFRALRLFAGGALRPPAATLA